MKCSNCTGSHYLCDNPALGDCTCVNAAAMQRVENQLVQLAGLVVALKESMYGGRDVKPKTGGPLHMVFEQAEKVLGR